MDDGIFIITILFTKRTFPGIKNEILLKNKKVDLLMNFSCFEGSGLLEMT